VTAAAEQLGLSPTPDERLARLRRAAYLAKYAWDCGIPGCDGQPHAFYPNRHARPKQLAPPGDWWAWFLMYGRGGGKTRSAAEWIKTRMLSEKNHRVAIIVPDFPIGRDVCVEGESGLLAVIPPEYVKNWNRSHGTLTLTNGSRAKIFGTNTQADAEKTRGDQYHTAWFEEIATQKYAKVAWDITTFAVRLGKDPRVIITSTPKPTKFIRKLASDPDIHLVDGVSTFDNQENLPERTLNRLKSQYQGTTLGMQELEGRILDAAEGALITHRLIRHVPEAPPLTRVVVAVDPAGTAWSTSDLTGIIVAGIDKDRNFYTLADKSGQYSPEGWRAAVLAAFEEFEADEVVAEVNYGGDMVRSNIRAGSDRVPVEVVHATRGKEIRATPVVSLYEQGRVYHITGLVAADFKDDGERSFGLDKLAEEWTTWIPPGRFNAEGDPIPPSDWSPNRLDAEVWAAHRLLLGPAKAKRRMRFEDD